MKIVVNGREYDDPEQLPAGVREDYERAMSALADNNGNGIPDILEMHLAGALGKPGDPPVRVVTSHEITIDGQRYDSLDQVPADKRQLVEEIQAKLAGLAGPSSDDTTTFENHTQRVLTFPASDSQPRGSGWSLSSLVVLFCGILIGLLIAVAVIVAAAFWMQR